MTTTNLGMDTPGHNSDIDSWDVPVNGNTNILDACFGNITTKSLASTPVTLSATESKVAILRFSGTLTSNVQVTLGGVVKSYIVENTTLGNFVVTLTGGSGNVIGLPPGKCQAYWDGTNCDFLNLGRVGEYWDYGGADTPAWVSACTVPPALKCDGSTFNAGTYPFLNTLYAGNTLPDLRGRTRFMLNGGTGRLTSAGGIDGNTRFAAGGSGTGLSVGQVNLPNINLAGSPNTGTINTNQDSVPYSVGFASLGIPAGTGTNYYINGPTPARLSVTLPNYTVPLGGSGTALASVPPGMVTGVTMVWAG